MSETRPRKVDLALLTRAIQLAKETSVENACRSSGISCSTIRNEMKRLGIARRRVGSFTSAELDTIGPKLTP